MPLTDLHLPARLTPPAGAEVHLWTLPLNAGRAIIGECRALLSPDERERADRFHFPKDHDRFVATRGVLRLLLARYLGCEPSTIRFEYRCVCQRPHCTRSRRKPELASNGAPHHLRFNVSHSDRLAIYAFAHAREIGVDVERIRDDVQWRAVAEECFSVEDAQFLTTMPPDAPPDEFFHCWTRKEAFLKAIGHGFSAGRELRETPCSPDELGVPVTDRTIAGPNGDWTMVDLDVEHGFAGALVVSGPAPALVYQPAI